MALPRPVKAVVFDMDGLLVDSEIVYCEALTAQCAHMGHELPLEVLKRMIGHAWAGSAAVLRDHFGQDFDADALRDGSVARFYEIAKAEIALKTGVMEILDHLDAVGLPRAICTSSRRVDVDHHLGAHDLAHRFHAILAQGDYPRPKPNPDPYLKAAEALGFAPQDCLALEDSHNGAKPNPDPYLKAAEALGFAPQDCLALEDSHNGVRAASSAGLMTIMVPDMLDPTEEMHSLCVRIARDLHEVRELLEAQR